MSSAITPDDDAFLRSFRTGEIANQQFHHRDHLRLAWIQIQRHGFEQATDHVTTGIRAFATHHGAADRYNDTMTRFWLWAVNHGIQLHPEASFEELLESEPHLLDKSLPFRHWSHEVMSADAAKQGWVTPDVRPLPGRL